MLKQFNKLKQGYWVVSSAVHFCTDDASHKVYGVIDNTMHLQKVSKYIATLIRNTKVVLCFNGKNKSA